MKITKSQLKALIREQVAAVINETDWRDVEWMEDRFHDDQDDWPEEEEEEILPRSEAAAKTYDELAAQIAEMILAHDKGLFGEAGGMDRGALLYVLEQAEKKYNELAAQEREEKNESVRITRRQLKRIIREAIDPAEPEAWAGNALTNDPELQAKEVNHNSLEVDGIDHSDYPDYSDAYFSYGEYVDGIEMNDDELNKLGMENPDLLYDTVQEFI